MHINYHVERFLRQSGLSPTKFGRIAAGDPRLVHDMRNGREIGERMANRLRGFMADYREPEQMRERIAA